MSTLPTEFVPYKSVTLEKLRFNLGLQLSREIEDQDRIVCYHIRGYVWAQDAGKKVTFQYPADWWQAFKERWFPAWLLKRFPVVHTVKEFLVKATYPDLNIQDHRPVLRLIQSTYDDLSAVTDYGRPECGQ